MWRDRSLRPKIPVSIRRSRQNAYYSATEFRWRKIEELEAADLYEVRFVLEFLQHVPDRVRAEKNFTRIGPKIFEQNLVALDPAAPGEVFTPLDYAPRPDSLARRLFSDEVIRAHLDTLAQAQGPDGGWSFNWTAWNPNTTLERIFHAWVDLPKGVTCCN